MGQQQLLLLVMGVVIVGLAVVGGLAAWDSIMKKSETDNLISRNLEIASSAVFWKTKKDPYAGGNQAYTGLNDNGFVKLFMESETHYGVFALESPAPSRLIVTGVSKRYPQLGVRTYVSGYEVDSTIVNNNGDVIIP